MRIFDEAGLDAVAVEDLQTKLEELIEDGATHEDVIRRGVELYDRDAFVIGILIGMEIGEANMRIAGQNHV